MKAPRLAAVAIVLLLSIAYAPATTAQVLGTGSGVCLRCGHSELDTQRYVNSFLNQLFFPYSAIERAAIAASLYPLTATFEMTGLRSPDLNFNSVTIAITAEVKNLLPTGNYHITVTTPGGTTSTNTYAIGDTRFSVTHDYAEGARRERTGRGGGGTGHGRPADPLPMSTTGGRCGITMVDGRNARRTCI